MFIRTLLTGCLVITLAGAVSVEAPFVEVPGRIMPDGGGGPDAWGYTWLDSDTSCPGAPVYNWIDITRLPGVIHCSTLVDDNVAGPLSMGIEFPLYWHTYSNFYLGSNGYISFDDDYNASHPFRDIPNVLHPNNVIAPLLSDLNPGNLPARKGYFYWHNDTRDTFIIQCESVPFWGVPTSNNTFQIILSQSDSTITYQYKEQTGAPYLGWTPGNATVGIENIVGLVGLRYLYGNTPSQNDIHPGLAIRFTPPATTSHRFHDMMVKWAMNSKSGGMFLHDAPIQPASIRACFLNAGNQIAYDDSMFAEIRDLGGTLVFAESAWTEEMRVGEQVIHTFGDWTPPDTGFYILKVKSRMVGDEWAGDDSVLVEIHVVNYTFPTTLYYDADRTGSVSLSGPHGFGTKFIPPRFPVRIDELYYYFTSAGAQCTVYVYDDDGPNGAPGTVLLDSVITTVAGWNSVDIQACSVNVQSGGFYVCYMTNTAGNPRIGLDNTLPHARRSLEFTGRWAEFRWNETQDFLIRAKVGQGTPTHDIAVTEMLQPSGNHDSGDVVIPIARIQNNGMFHENGFNVTFTITGSGYQQTRTCSLNRGTSDTVAFPPWTAMPGYGYVPRCSIHLAADVNPVNDTISGAPFDVYGRDVGTAAILAPRDTTNYGDVITPEAEILNYGNSAEDFLVRFKIPGAGYQDSANVHLGVGESDTVTFDTWLADTVGNPPAMTCSTELGTDMNPDNDRATAPLFIRYADVGAIQILQPVGSYDTLTTIIPSARVTNVGNAPETFKAFLTVNDPTVDAPVYSESLNVLLHPDVDSTVIFPPTRFHVIGTHTAKCSVHVGWEQDWTNNVIDNDFQIIPTIPHNVTAQRILAPTGTIDSGAVVTPSVIVRNTGLSTETFDVHFTIDPGYHDSATVSALPPATSDTVEFADWTAQPRDSTTATAWTLLIGDEMPEDDTTSLRLLVQVRDVGVEQVISPVGTLPVDTIVYPECRVRNYGNTTETFDVEFRIGHYLGTATATALAPGNTQDLVMSQPYTTQVGVWLDRARTTLTGDINPANDLALDTLWVPGPVTHDVGVDEILAPVGTVNPGQTITPSARVANYGDQTETFRAYFAIYDTTTDAQVYDESLHVTLAPVTDTTLPYPDVSFTLQGPYTTHCSTYLPTDQNQLNNVKTGQFHVKLQLPWDPGWHEVQPIPLQPSGKPVKRGAWATHNHGDDLIYTAKGYKTTDYYSYNPLANTWNTLTGMPYQRHTNPKWARKVPRKGSKGAADGDNYIYVTQGNNTLGFWRYDIDLDSWTTLHDIPAGPNNKKVKGGTDLAYLVRDDGQAYIYLLKGYRTEFYRYHITANTWQTLAPAPTGKRAKWGRGSWLIAQNQTATTLYAHKAKYNELWSYDVPADSWDQQLTGMPYVGMQGRKKKSKDGGSADWYDSEIYALKGGNTNEFWKYTPTTDTWTELDSMPTMGSTGRKKRVKYGADLVNYAGYPAFFSLKGNKTREMWRYYFGSAVLAVQPRPGRGGVLAEPSSGIRQSSFDITPNPLAGGFATLRYSLPRVGHATASIYDATGRAVTQQTVLAGRTGAVNLDLRSLSAGVYLVRFEAGGFSTTRKLVLQR